MSSVAGCVHVQSNYTEEAVGAQGRSLCTGIYRLVVFFTVSMGAQRAFHVLTSSHAVVGHFSHVE